ncbi:uncharacterized protein PHACADRAFT_24938 [Phanerochaete carnosa HHB-10118-sp]|uniref:Uncharacterized protein n=1 Tax=Phanerochaete carnosa (strain HHB-10118-sp) TaxID=650164 RepID=K5XFF7_PHACS|nr:uncharacterized protein PHACADRAFT_24938 [Phanerochaete carnosa HHB-10118-sp]EKM61797.1 hypothetical protein PHACADRAFT_24938 [Phanerochaete carnosa HHB-10118-sp]
MRMWALVITPMRGGDYPAILNLYHNGGMPSRRRDRSESRERSHSRSRGRSPSSERDVPLPNNAPHISESDYFLRSDEFRVWLKDEKRKYLDELSSEKSRKYFRKFVKAWNRGKLPSAHGSLYYGVEAQSASSQTGYKWSFASKTSKADIDALRATREEISAATYKRSLADHASSPAGGSSRIQGPTLPGQADLTLAREDVESLRATERELDRKRKRKVEKERIEDVVGPKEVGREGMLEKKRARREADRAFKEKGDDGFEADESTLMGGGDGFQERIRQRDAARQRKEEQRHGARDEREAATRQRADAIRQKEKETMDMFMQLAKEKFG